MCDETLSNILERSRISLKNRTLDFSIQLNTLQKIFQMRPKFLTDSDINFLVRLLKQSDTSEADYINICQFFIQCLSHEKLIDKIVSSQLFNSISNISRFNNDDHLENCRFYSKNARNSSQLLWLWTLEVVNIAIHYMLNKNHKEIMVYIIKFIKKYFKRFIMILSYKFAETKNDPKNTDEMNFQVHHKTYAYLQELEKMISILNQLYTITTEWRNSAKSQFETIFYLLTNCTIKIICGNSPLVISENFIPKSQLEKISYEIILSQKSC